MPNDPKEFSESLYSDFSWRLKELSELKVGAKDPSFERSRAHKRALVVMCYAHWEGHIKHCAETFVAYICKRRFRFVELGENFYKARFLKSIEAYSHAPLESKFELVDQILHSESDRLSRMPDGIINTRSNLNSGVLREILLVCGIEAEFEDDADFIDRLLLRRRNEVAHGQALFVDAIEPDDLVQRTQSLMRYIRDCFDNSISLDEYKAAKPMN